MMCDRSVKSEHIQFDDGPIILIYKINVYVFIESIYDDETMQLSQ